MSWRTVVIDSRCKLDTRMGYLMIRGEDVQRVFLDEIAVLIIENPAVSLTGCLIQALTEKKVKIIFCDAARNPVCETVPCHGSHDSSDRIRQQIRWDRDFCALVRKNKPPKGLVQVLSLTEKQFAQMECIVGEFRSDVLDSTESLVIY